MVYNKKKYIYIAIALLLGIAIIALSVVLLLGRTQDNGPTVGATPNTGIGSTSQNHSTTASTPSSSAGSATSTAPSAPTDPQPTDPQPTDPQPTDPQPTDPQPTDPQPTDPQPTDPQPTDPQPTDPQPTDPQPTDPQPTDPQPTDPQPTDPQPTDPQPTDPQPTDPQPTDPQPTDPQPTDPQPTDPQPTDPQPTDPQPTDPEPTEPAPTDPPYDEEGEKLEEVLGPAQITLLKPEASGVLVKENKYAIIDYSNTKDGYVMVKYIASTTMRLKVQVIGPTTTYTYNIQPDEWTVFPLSDGNGEYTIKVYQNVEGNKYATKLSLKCTVELEDEFAPFLRPNQYVNYENATETMNKAASLLNDKMTVLEKVETIYDYVIKNFKYDYDKAENLQSGYLPDLDKVLKAKKGICFDYAALMAAMLRSQNIPCKLVVGYAGSTYHAWISVWSPETGWVDGAIFFNGTNWALMDPTFASGGADYSKVEYTSKYIY